MDSDKPASPPLDAAAGGRRVQRSRGGRAIELAPLFDRRSDHGAIERMLLALAVHPHGAGFERAHLLVWSVDHAMLEGRLAWHGGRGRRSIGEALARAQRQASDGTDPESTRRLRSIALAPADLEGPLAAAWAGGTSAAGPAPASGGYLWKPETLIGAIGLDGGGRGYGLIVGEWSDGTYTPQRERALEALRRLANAALDTHRAAEELRRLSQQGAALAELARAMVSPLNLAEALNLAMRLAAQATGVRGGALWTRTKDGAPELQAAHGPAGGRERLGRQLQPLVASVIERGRTMVIDRPGDEPLLGPEAAAQLTSLAMIPLVVHGRTLGALAVFDRAAFHPAESAGFDPVDLAFLRSLCDQVALVLEHARVSDLLRHAEQARQDLQRRLSRSERLAAVGERAARAAHEARNPLASIGAFARRALRQRGEGDPGREYLEVVLREVDRLELLMQQQSQVMLPGSPRLKVENANALIQSALQQAGERLVRRRVRLLKKLSPDVPPLVLDAERIGRAFANILAHALDAVSPGGRIRIESRRVQHHVVIDVAHDGSGSPGVLIDQLFVPFEIGSQEGGVNLGLAVAQQIVHEHGGEVRVRAEGEWSSIFSFTLPIGDNEDRRRIGRDRRATRHDRRERFPSA